MEPPHQHPSSSCFPPFLLRSFLPLWITLLLCTSITPTAPLLLTGPLPQMPCPFPHHPSLSWLCKLPVIDPDHITVVFPPCVHRSLSIQGQTLMRPPQRPHWWEPQCEKGWPSPRAPRTEHQLPRGSPPNTKTSTVDRNLKGHREKEIEGERVEKREEISCSNSLRSVRWKIIKRKWDRCMTSA